MPAHEPYIPELPPRRGAAAAPNNKLIELQALLTLAREQANMEDHDNLKNTIMVAYEKVFEL